MKELTYYYTLKALNDNSSIPNEQRPELRIILNSLSVILYDLHHLLIHDLKLMLLCIIMLQTLEINE